jgi:glycosyltransferase involved in cell wall biosynthesis
MKNNSIGSVEVSKTLMVKYFQRRPRKGFSFSMEYIFDDIRARLANRINSQIFISACYNDGYYSKIINIIQAAFRQGKDVNHITGEVHFLNLLMSKNKVILTIHDCGVVPRKTGMAKQIVNWLYLKAPVSKAAIVTAASEVTKRDIVQYTGCNPNKIKVIPVAVNPMYKPDTKLFNKALPNILHIGTGYNKNLERLVEALIDIKCHLVIVGKLSEELREKLNNSNIHFSNEYNIPNERLFQLYKDCDILSFISTFEGFGMPIIEANSVERVVITSNISSMPEVAGNAAKLVDPYDVDSIRKGIAQIINDDNYREQLIANGRLNKLRFDAETIADQYYQLYKSMYLSKSF